MKKLLLIAAFVLLVLPFAAMAEATDTLQWDVYMSATDAGDTALGEAPWVGPFIYGEPIPDTIYDSVAVVAPDSSVWIGIPNGFRWVNLKTLWVRVIGGADLTVDTAIGYNEGGVYGIVVIEDAVVVGADLHILISIFPQPDWEVIVLTNNTGGPIVIASIEAESECVFIPTMTHYGLGILALLLIGSTVWVLRRRRVGSVA